ncbi:hypothetical protein EON83_15860 [bacterium]|nr:MAG: hypothetical protein EON83_15860 [bacterium]
MAHRPTCFQALFTVISALLATLGVRLLIDGAWSPQSTLFRPMLACFGCALLIFGLGIAALLYENWPRK